MLAREDNSNSKDTVSALSSALASMKSADDNGISSDESDDMPTIITAGAVHSFLYYSVFFDKCGRTK